MATAGRTYGGVPAAERQAERRRRLLDAALDLIGERGVAGLTVRDVCAGAELSKRYFYEEFASLDALVEAVLAAAVDELVDKVFGPPPDGTTDLPRARVAAYVRAVTADPRLARLVLVETLGGGALTAHRNDLVHRAVELLLEDFLAPSPTADRGPEGLLTAYALSGASSELLVAWVEGHVDASPDEIVDFLVGLFSQLAGSPR